MSLRGFCPPSEWAAGTGGRSCAKSATDDSGRSVAVRAPGYRKCVPFRATAYRLLLSAPGDVRDEDIAAATRAIERWNALYGVGSAAVVIPTTWIDHSAARFGDRPQSVLNEQLVDTADIVIAIFWNRLGSPTGEAESGTIEEIARADSRGARVGILRAERPVKQEEVDPEQLTRLREYFATIRGEALFLGYEDVAGLARHVEAILNQAVARGSAELADDQSTGSSGASVWPRVDRERYQETDSKGRLKTRTRWHLVLVNDGSELARDVSFALEPYGAGAGEAGAPMILDGETSIEALAPKREIAYTATLHSGTTNQARCTVRWTDSRGPHEETSVVGFN